VGRAKALEMLLTNRWISGQEAYEIGLVNEVTPREKLYERVEEVAKGIASWSPKAVRSVKQAVQRGMDMGLSQGLELEKRLASQLALTQKTS
jgi:enoyl-CoA hydratase